MKSIKRWLIGLVLFALLLPVLKVAAQDLRDPGISEPYHPSRVHYRVGIYFAQQGNYERALDEFTQAIDGMSGYGSAYAARGDVYLSQGEYQLAIADYSSAIDIYPNFVSVLYTRGRAYHAAGDLDFAVSDYVNAIGQMPEYPMPYWGLGDLQYEQERYGEALDNYYQYLTLIVDVPDEQVVARVAALEIFAGADAL